MSIKGKYKGEFKVEKRKTDQKAIMESELERAPKYERHSAAVCSGGFLLFLFPILQGNRQNRFSYNTKSASQGQLKVVSSLQMHCHFAFQLKIDIQETVFLVSQLQKLKKMLCIEQSCECLSSIISLYFLICLVLLHISDIKIDTC